MKTLDHNYLSSHPDGDEKAVLSFSAAVPKNFNLPANPDGTRPRITLKATGENYLEVIQALDYIRENECEELLWELLEQVVTEEEATAVGGTSGAVTLLKTRTKEVILPFRTLSVELGIESTDSFGVKTSSDVELELTTPSLEVGIGMILSVTKPSNLVQAMIGLCPEAETEEDEDGEHHVLVTQ
ncbi:MAG TPA: hypothetical protein VF867_10920 [Arthrobacter sp.]